MKTIGVAIGLQVLAITCVIVQKIVLRLEHEKLNNIQFKSLLEPDYYYTFPFIYLLLNILGIYGPIFIQIALIKVSTLGNWNELLQSDL